MEREIVREQSQRGRRQTTRQMLQTAGVRIDAEGTSRGVAWIQATRARAPAVATDDAERRAPAIPRHALLLSGGHNVGGLALRAFGLDTSGLWIAGTGVVLIHLGGAFFGLTALRGWLRRSRRRRSAA